MMTVTKRKTGKSRRQSAAKPLALELVGTLGPKLFDTNHLLRNLKVAVKRAEKSKKPVKMTVFIDPQQPRSRIDIVPVTSEASGSFDSVLQAARQRGTQRIAEILNSEDMLSADAFADEIGATRETVNNKRKRHEILGLDGPKRGIRFPKWQLSDAGELLPGLPELFRALGGRPWAVYRFLLTEHPELDGKRGLDAMQSGHVSEAIEVANSIAGGAYA
jgi:hypothetical protein